MFSRQRDNTRRITYLVGTDRKGKKHFIHYKYAGSGGMNQVRKQMRKSVGLGRADDLCKAVADRLSRKSKGTMGKIENVEIVTGTFRLEDFYRQTIRPISKEVEASAKVDRD